MGRGRGDGGREGGRGEGERGGEEREMETSAHAVPFSFESKLV